MKNKGTFTFVLVASIFAAEALIGADAPKKSAAAAPQTGAAIPAPAVEAVIPDPVAVVEGVEIKKAELESALTAILAQRGQSPAALPPEQKPSIYRMVLDDLIIDKLVSKRAQEMKVEDAEVDEMIAKLKKNFGSDEEFNAQVEKMGQTVEKVKENIRMNLRQQHWVDEQVKGKVEVTEAEAKDFYEKNGDQFKQPEQVRASHILIAVPQDAKPDVVAEKEKAAKAIAGAGEKRRRLSTKWLRRLSEDPSAKENSGDLGLLRPRADGARILGSCL